MPASTIVEQRAARPLCTRKKVSGSTCRRRAYRKRAFDGGSLLRSFELVVPRYVSLSVRHCARTLSLSRLVRSAHVFIRTPFQVVRECAVIRHRRRKSVRRRSSVLITREWRTRIGTYATKIKTSRTRVRRVCLVGRCGKTRSASLAGERDLHFKKTACRISLFAVAYAPWAFAFIVRRRRFRRGRSKRKHGGPRLLLLARVRPADSRTRLLSWRPHATRTSESLGPNRVNINVKTKQNRNRSTYDALVYEV